MTQEARAQLDYAHGFKRRNRYRVWVGPVIVLAVVPGIVLIKSPWFGQKLKRLDEIRAVSRCMGYTAPAGKVVLECAPQEAAALLRDHPSEYMQYQPGDGWPAISLARAPESWLRLPFFGSPPDRTVVFLHERTIPNGGGRFLVALAYCANVGVPGPCFRATIIDRGSMSQPMQSVWQYVIAAPVPTRIYFGQPDPNDDSHFTVRTVSGDGLEDAYDGYLRKPVWPTRGPSAEVQMTLRPRPTTRAVAPTWP
jgi:hypothetical protein